MKLKALAAMCKDSKRVLLLEAPDGSQWAGTGEAVWRLPDNLGSITTAALCTVFDIPADKQAKMVIRSDKLADGINTEDYAAGEKDLLYWLDRRLMLDGEDVLPMKAPSGEIFCVKTQWLRPGSDAEQPGLCLRRMADGKMYVVFKDGLFVTGVLFPRAPKPEQATWLADVCQGITVEE